jgi:hypothetical protein
MADPARHDARKARTLHWNTTPFAYDWSASLPNHPASVPGGGWEPFVPSRPMQNPDLGVAIDRSQSGDRIFEGALELRSGREVLGTSPPSRMDEGDGCCQLFLWLC